MCDDFKCPYRNLNGYCSITACIKPISKIQEDKIIFPQTIGNITFYNKAELFKWVINQQKMNKNPDYGCGIYS